MTVLPQGSEISRRRLLQFGAAAGFLLGTGSLAGCAGPTGLPGASTLTLALNRSLVSLDNKLNQFDAAVTVQRSVRQGLTAIGPETKPILVLAERFEMTGPTEWTVTLREGIRYSDGSPVQIQDIATALKMYQQVQGSFVAGFFPEFPEVVPVDDRTFKMVSKKPVPRETCADRPCSTKQQPTTAAPEKSSACTNTEATVLLSKSVVGWNPLTAGSFPSS
jgi:peptide/nickel transport system substrate-binding protein